VNNRKTLFAQLSGLSLGAPSPGLLAYERRRASLNADCYARTIPPNGVCRTDLSSCPPPHSKSACRLSSFCRSIFYMGFLREPVRRSTLRGQTRRATGPSTRFSHGLICPCGDRFMPTKAGAWRLPHGLVSGPPHHATVSVAVSWAHISLHQEAGRCYPARSRGITTSELHPHLDGKLHDVHASIWLLPNGRHLCMIAVTSISRALRLASRLAPSSSLRSKSNLMPIVVYFRPT